MLGDKMHRLFLIYFDTQPGSTESTLYEFRKDVESPNKASIILSASVEKDRVDMYL